MHATAVNPPNAAAAHPVSIVSFVLKTRLAKVNVHVHPSRRDVGTAGVEAFDTIFA
jgi:hypothetical protein